MRLSIVILLIGAVLLTQRWYDWDKGIELGGTDALSYEEIALAAPAFPATQPPFHHAQRLAGPYLVGTGAKATGLNVRTAFLATTGACLLLAVTFLAATLSKLSVSIWEFALCVSLFVLDFTLRFYLVVPGMLPAALFICGLSLTLYGLAGSNFAIVLVGALVAAAGRQTALLMLPGVAWWMAFGEGWALRSAANRAAGILIVAGAVAAVYLASGHLASLFGSPSENVAHLTGVYEWLLSPSFSVDELGMFLAYLSVPLVLAVTVIAAALWSAERWQPSPEFLACCLFSGAIISQPVLGAPDANAVRLSALSLTPLVLAAALQLRQAGYPKAYWKYRGPLIIGALTTASLHYNYTWIGPVTKIQFAILHVTMALFIGYLIFRSPSQRIKREQRDLTDSKTG